MYSCATGKSSPRWFVAKKKAWQREGRDRMELARLAGWMSVLPHVERKGGRQLRPSDIVTFPWEKKGANFPPIDPVAMKKFEEEARDIFTQFGFITNGES